jgi:hypothetical protein
MATMKLGVNKCAFTAFLVASSFPRAMGLRVPLIRSRHRVVSASTASLLNIPEAIHANGEEEHQDRQSFEPDKVIKKP